MTGRRVTGRRVTGRRTAGSGRTAAGTAALTVLLTVVMGLLGAPAASAHPLGNATVNHYDGVTLFTDHVTDTAVEDIAEIPTFQRRGQVDVDGDGVITAADRAAYAARRCAALAAGIAIVVGGERVPLTVLTSSYTQRPGAIGLPASRLDCALSGPARLTTATTVTVADDVDGAGIGWHEVTAQGVGVALAHSPFPAASISDALRRYPNDLLSSPLDVRGGTVSVTPGGGASTYAATRRVSLPGPLARALNGLTTTFNHAVGARHLTVAVGLLALLLSLALGAGHAVLPGHGKTVMAAYLVGRRGRVRDVVAVGATVTLTHTAGVLLLGLAITTTASFAPTQAEQLLAVASGLIIVAVGVGLLAAAVRRRRRPLLGAAVVPALATLGGPGPTTPGTRPGAVSVARSGVLSAAGSTGGPVASTLLADPEPGHRPGHPATTHPHPPGHRLRGGDGHGAGQGAGAPHDHDHDHGPAHDGADHLHGQDHQHAGHEHGHDHDGHEDHEHGDAHGHAHGHAHTAAGTHRHGFGRAHRHGPTADADRGPLSRGGLIGLGVAGGLVPSPSALLVLLAAAGLGRTAFGVLLVVGYGVGMAGTLSVAGLLLVRLRGRLERWAGHPRLARADRLLAALPVVTALLVVVVGVALTARAAGGGV